MKCSLIRDLMPIYDSGKCSKVTKEVIHDHFKTCESCRSIYEEMHEGIGLRESIEMQQEPFEDKNMKDTEFWSKYYGKLITKGLAVFIIIYISAIILKLILRGYVN